MTVRNVWTLFRAELPRLFANAISIIITIGLVVLPSLFSWYNILACWNVFDNTGNLKVAVANSDAGYESDLVPLRVNVGDQVVSTLRANDQIGWVFTSEEDAVEGARSGAYYAAVVIPEQFSQDMLTFYADGAEKAQIVYYSNGKKNAIAPKITDQGADTISYQVNEAFAQTLSEVSLTLAEALSRTVDDADASGAIAVLSGHLDDTAGQMSQAANVLKAVRLVEDFEADGAGLAQVARSFARFVDECGKDKPGALTASERNYVQIMTVHASKGLEFPIVALADCWKVSARETAGNLLVKHARGTVYCSLRPGRADEAVRKIEKAYAPEESTTPLFERVRTERSAFAYRELLKAFIAQESLEERRRCFYVAVTRASEALIPVFTEEGAPIVEDVRTALCGDGPWPEREGLLDYGGAEPARFTRVTVTAEERDAYRRAQAERAGERPAFTVPEYGEREPLCPAPWRPVREGMWSYSSLSEHAGAGESGKDECEEGGRAADEPVSGALPEQAPGADAFAGEADGLDAGYAPDEAFARALAEPAMAPSPFALDDDAAWEEIAANLAEDADRATDLGSAFHLIAQCAVEERAAGTLLACPSDERVRAIERACRVTPDQTFRLRKALDRWFASETAARAAACESVRAEVPFCIALDAGGAREAGDLAPDAVETSEGGFVPRNPFYLEGEIDLLCENGEGEPVLVVDYKTGGCADETPERLQEKHGLQARCYALAVLRQGAPAVELRFVRVEQEDAERPGQPQEVVYRFERADLPALEDAVRAAWRKVNGQVR